MISYEGGNGKNVKEAIIITGASSHGEGIESEYDYVSKLYGIWEIDWVCEMQECSTRPDGIYDCLTITLKDGKKKKLYFDITEFFDLAGKDILFKRVSTESKKSAEE